MSSSAESQAFAWLQAGRLVEAEAAWRAILARDPGDTRAGHFLGCVLARAGRVDEGLALLDRSVEREPRNTLFLANRAQVLADAGRAEDAMGDLRKAIRIDARFAAAYRHLGLLLARSSRHDEAVAALRRAAALEPANPGAHASLGRTLYDTGDAPGARAAFERALAALPGDAALLNNLGLALAAEGLHAEAIARYSEALNRRPGFAEALLNWGHALRERGDLAGASERYDRALEAQPGFPEAMLARAGASLDAGDLADARERYRRALDASPAYADARYGLGQVALREHRFAEGWAGYEARFATRPPQARVRDVGLPSLGPESLSHVKRVAVLGEQGLGDQLLFATLLGELERRGIAMVLDLDPRLGPMLARRLNGAIAADRSLPDPFVGCDARAPLGSLGGLFRPDVASFAAQPRSLLAADAERSARYAAMLPPGKPRVGISWRSFRDGGRGAFAMRKSAPLECFAHLAGPGAVLVDLQYGDLEAERERFGERHPGRLARIAGLDATNDLEGVVAAIAACDVVVSTSSVTAHLAGASGKPTLLVCLGANPPFAYWVPGEDGRSLWYPSVRVVSGPELDTWDKVLRRAGEMIDEGGWCC